MDKIQSVGDAVAHVINQQFHTIPPVETCMGRTCMKWSADGELTDLDLQLILERLGQVDHQISHALTKTRGLPVASGCP